LNYKKLNTNEWVRITVRMNYLDGFVAGEENFFQIMLDGYLMTNSLAYTDPSNILSAEPDGGSWFLCYNSGEGAPDPSHNNSFLSSITLQGVGRADDVVVTGTQPFVPEAYTNGGGDALSIWLADNGGIDANYDEGDGIPAWKEFWAQTDPNDPNSSFKVIDQSSADGSNTVVWTGKSLTGNFLMRRTDDLIGGTWGVVDVGIPNNPDDSGTNTWSEADPGGVAPSFYRPGIDTTP
jgi:hypothetical protein